MTSAPMPTPNQPESGGMSLRDPGQITTGAGLVTLVIGVALAVRPEATSRRLGLGLGTRGARALALSDLAIAPVLIAGGRRGPWMAVRALMNLGIAARYRSLLRGSGGASARGGLALMSALTVLDGAAAFSLSRRERDLA